MQSSFAKSWDSVCYATTQRDAPRDVSYGKTVPRGGRELALTNVAARIPNALVITHYAKIATMTSRCAVCTQHDYLVASSN